MGDLIGGAIADILAQQSAAERTADETAQASLESQQVAARIQQEVSAIAGEVEAAFRQLSERLQDTVHRTTGQLEATEWHGKSRDALVAFDADLQSKARQFLTATESGVASFRGNLLAFIQEFYDTIHTEWAATMQDIRDRYGDAARAAATYARSLEELDATAITL
jgi:hypothetical protein